MTISSDYRDAVAAAGAADRSRRSAADATYSASYSAANATYGNVAANFAVYDLAVKAAQAVKDAALLQSEMQRQVAVAAAHDTALGSGELCW